MILRAGESSSGHILDSSSDEEESKFDDESTRFLKGNNKGSKKGRRGAGGLTNAEKALKKGYAVSDLARNAMVNLRSQRDTLVDTLGTLRSMGSDLVRTE